MSFKAADEPPCNYCGGDHSVTECIKASKDSNRIASKLSIGVDIPASSEVHPPDCYCVLCSRAYRNRIGEFKTAPDTPFRDEEVRNIEDARYERLEKEHLGDYEKKTGIYAPKTEEPSPYLTPAQLMYCLQQDHLDINKVIVSHEKAVKRVRELSEEVFNCWGKVGRLQEDNLKLLELLREEVGTTSLSILLKHVGVLSIGVSPDTKSENPVAGLTVPSI